MTPRGQDIPEASEELTTTEFSSACLPGVAEDMLPDVPPMEQLPDYDALPDPGYPEMPPPVTVPSVSGSSVSVSRPADGPDAESWPHPPVWPPAVPVFTPARSIPPADEPGDEKDDQAAAAQALPEEPARRTTTGTLTQDLLPTGKRATADTGWRRTVYRATGGLVRLGESPATMRQRDLVNRIRTPVVGGHHRVAVLSLQGGAGKTTVTVGLGATLASLRDDRVIAVDGNDDRAVTGVLEHYYSICITDCGAGLSHSAMAGVLELADQIVLVSPPSVDGARGASATLDWLEAHGHGDLVRGCVVVLSPVRGKVKSTVDLDRLEQHFAARCRAVVRVPYLEEGTEFELDSLAPEAEDAYLTLAAEVATAFARPSRSSASSPPGSPLP